MCRSIIPLTENNNQIDCRTAWITFSHSNWMRGGKSWWWEDEEWMTGWNLNQTSRGTLSCLINLWYDGCDGCSCLPLPERKKRSWGGNDNQQEVDDDDEKS